MKSVFLFSLIAIALAHSGSAAETLWSIGKSDNNASEFAHAPDRYSDYSAPGLFIIGESDPAQDWPYLQPGPADDAWAGSGSGIFSVWFVLESTPNGESSLILDLADTQERTPPTLRTSLNEASWEHSLPAGAGSYADPSAGREHVIAIPVSDEVLRKGLNRLDLEVVDGSWLMWDSLRLEAPAGARMGEISGVANTLVKPARSEPALFWDGPNKVRRVDLEVVHLGSPTGAALEVGEVKTPVELSTGRSLVSAMVSPPGKIARFPVALTVAGQRIPAGEVELRPVREWEIHLVHQTHLDIGYTDRQEEVLAKQIEHLRHAMRLVKKTADYPEDARFIWHPEGMWAVEEFMRVASEEEKREFLEACRNKQIHIDILYAQAMTGMYTEEELMELMGSAARFGEKYGVEIPSAMQSDVPGYTWGMATALAAHGVKFMSVGPNWTARGNASNYFNRENITGGTHRGGRVFAWADQPFWWVSPSGRHKILFWMPGWGYSGFHGDRGAIHKEKIFAYLDHLKDRDYPYDMVYWRYGIGADNGPPRDELPDLVRDWNETYASPRLIIASNSGALRRFAERYGDRIPELAGDFTPYWEDGAASTADATGVNRRASERTAQLQTLWSILDPELPLHEEMNTAWHKLILYDEHTWGAYNSISEPDSQFAIDQDAYKQAYARDASRMVDTLIDRVTGAPESSNTVDVHNTSSWPRGSVVKLSAEQSAAGDRVTDEAGGPVPSQRLASGELAFFAENIPALGARRFNVGPGQAYATGNARATAEGLRNGLLTIGIDPESGAIRTLHRRGLDGSFVDTSKAAGLNDYLYILGRNPDQGRATIDGPVTVTVEDPGPLVATVRIDSSAPGAKSLTRRLQLAADADYLMIENIVDKLKERRPEGVYFGFPFDLPDALPRIDVPLTTVEVEQQQLRGANRNFYCVQRWVDLANERRGVTWVTVDAHTVQFDPIKIAPAFGLEQWRETIDPGSHIWSWTMNNHWETNYKADQEGPIRFEYAIRPYAGGYDPVASQRFGREVCQPLITALADPSKNLPDPLFDLTGDPAVVVTTVRPSRDGAAWMVRLFNTSESPAETGLSWGREVGAASLSSPTEECLEPAPPEIQLKRHELVTLRVEREASR